MELINQVLPWINLSCFGVYEGFMIIGVEVPNSPPRAPRPKPRTSVNYSGPPAFVLENGWDASLIMTLD